MTRKPEAFWDFSLRAYGYADVARSCLALQNRNGCDVNLLLFCCWGGLTFGVIADDVLATAVDHSQRWNTRVVGPLRSARNWMKGKTWVAAADAHETLRNRIKSVEFEAERLQQATLGHLLGNLTDPEPNAHGALDAMVNNLGRYLGRAGIAADRTVRGDLEVLLHGAAPYMDLETIRRGVERLGTDR
jgi:uncharacterized protein (TIGR02444 family)